MSLQLLSYKAFYVMNLFDRMPPGKNSVNYKHALEEREIARMRKLEELALRTHFPPEEPLAHRYVIESSENDRQRNYVNERPQLIILA